MELTTVKLADLHPDPKNARIHSEKNIKEIVRSLKQNGQYRPFVVQKSTMKILVGNGMYEAMKRMDTTEAEAYIIDIDDKKATKLALTDNRTSELAEWDFDTLSELLADLDGDIPGWDMDDLADILEPDTADNVEEVDVPDVQEETKSKLGDIWLLGKHRLMCGDSTLVDDVEKLMDGQKADMVFTDPPYGVSYTEKNEYLNSLGTSHRLTKAIENDSKKPTEMFDFWKIAFSNLFLFTKDRMSYYVTAPQGGDLLLLLLQALRDSGFALKHQLVWNKNNHVLGRCDYNYKHEPIVYGWKIDRTHEFYGGGKCKTSVWDFNKPLKSDLHPTMKPVELIAEALLNSTKENDNVIDLFGGSGSTLIACEQLNRRCYMMELDEHYCDVIVRRWQKLTGKEATHAVTGEKFGD